MGTRVRKNAAKQVSVSTTGDLLDLREPNGVKPFTRPKILEISSLETDAADTVFVETGATTEGGAVGSDARAIPCSALPVELDVYGQGAGIKLYGSKDMDLVVVVR